VCKIWTKIPNRFGKNVRKNWGGGFFLTHTVVLHPTSVTLSRVDLPYSELDLVHRQRQTILNQDSPQLSQHSWQAFNEAKLYQNLCTMTTVPSTHTGASLGLRYQTYLRVVRLRHDHLSPPPSWCSGPPITSDGQKLT